MSLLGNLTVGVLGNMSGLSGTFKDAQTEVQKFGKGLERVGRDISSVGDTLTRRITMPAMAAATALTGITLVKGFNRLVGIDTAQAKLKALGHDAQNVELIMTSALDSVRGTAFGLDEAATTAANAVAAGIPAGEELTRYLSLTSDTAAIAGVSLADMGSILNKVTTAGKAYNGELQQLAARGLPVYQWLAEEAGTTAEAIFDMASKGEISTEMLLNAIENNIGGAAKIMGEESFTAAIANIGADIARIGAAFLNAGGEAGGFFSTIKPLLTEFRAMLASVEERAAGWGEKFGEAFNRMIENVREVKAWFDNLSPSMQEVILKATGIGAAFLVGLGPALKIVGTLITSVGQLIPVFSALVSPVGLAVVAIAGLTAGLVYLYNTNETVRESIHAAWEFLRSAGEEIWGAISGFIMDKIDQIKAFWDDNGEQILEAVTNVFNAIKAVIEFVMPAIQWVIEYVWGAITRIFSGALDVIMGAIKIFSGLFTGDWEKLWEGVKQLLGGAVDVILGIMSLSFLGGIRTILTNLLKTGVNLVRNLSTSIVNVFKNMHTTANNIVSGMVNGVINFFRNMFTQVSNIFNQLRTFGATVWNSISQAILSIARNIWNGVTSNFTNMLNSVRNLTNNIKGTIVNIWNEIIKFLKGINLTQIGKDIIQGLINGIKGMAGAAIDSVRDIGRGISDSIKGFFAIRSPSRLMQSYGEDIGKGLAIGIEEAVGKVTKATKDMANAVTHEAEVGLDISNFDDILSRVGNIDSPRRTSSASSEGGLFERLSNLIPEYIQTAVYLDGKKIAEVTSRNQYNQQQSKGRGLGYT